VRYLVKITLPDGEQVEGQVVHPDGPDGPKPKDLRQAREIAKNMQWLDQNDGESVNVVNKKKIKVWEA